jgi:hypothetical protein
MERTTIDDSIDYNLEQFRESARERANERGMSVHDYLALQIYLSSAVLKNQLSVMQQTLGEREYIAWCSAVQETYEGARLLAAEVDNGVQ